MPFQSGQNFRYNIRINQPRTLFSSLNSISPTLNFIIINSISYLSQLHPQSQSKMAVDTLPVCGFPSPCRFPSPHRETHRISKLDCNFAHQGRNKISPSQLFLAPLRIQDFSRRTNTSNSKTRSSDSRVNNYRPRTSNFHSQAKISSSRARN
jgi:hypothetical protein